jgi:hypothetical protein
MSDVDYSPAGHHPLQDDYPHEFDIVKAAEIARAAENILDRPYADPDDDAAMLARFAVSALASSPAPACPACGGNGHDWWPVGDDSYACNASSPAPAGLSEAIDAIADALNGWDMGEPPRPDTHRHWAKIVGALRTSSPAPAGLDALTPCVCGHAAGGHMSECTNGVCDCVEFRAATRPAEEGESNG